jgi:hypothetical protein
LITNNSDTVILSEAKNPRIFARSARIAAWPHQKSLGKQFFVYSSAMKLRRIVGAVGGLLLLCVVCVLAFLLWTVMHPQSLNRGLAEEKSYFKHAGTYYRMRRELWGQKGNFETWDEAEQIVAVVRSKGDRDVWAAWSDKLDYMPQTLRLDPARRRCASST